jgi:hypothetical protein
LVTNRYASLLSLLKQLSHAQFISMAKIITFPIAREPAKEKMT